MTLLQDQAEAVLRGRNCVLEKLVSGAPLEEVLESLACVVEELAPDQLCSILLVDKEKQCLRHGAAPSLPKEYSRLVDGLAIGPQVGSCGAAAALGRRVIAEDLETHPNWEPFRLVTRKAGLGACWSEPILSARRGVVGTFAMYYREARRPQQFDLELISRLAGVAGVALDFKHLERERSALQVQLRQIIDLDPHMIFARDWEGRFLLANEAVAQAYGTTVKGVTGQSLGDFHSTREAQERALAEDRKVMASGKPEVVEEETFQDADGHQRVLQTTRIPFSAGGVERAVLGVAVDITELKATQESLRRSELAFRQLAETITEVFWLTDWRKNEMIYVSPAYETVWGRSRQSLFDDPASWSESIHPEDRARVVAAFRSQAALGDYEEEYRLLRADGSLRWIRDRAFPISDSTGEIYRVAGISEDVTDRKNVELDLQRTRDELDARSRKQLSSMQSELLLAEERERKRLAGELHDGLGQTIALAHMKLGALRKRLPPSEADELEAIAKWIESANQQVRSMSFQLSPPILYDLGFVPAVQWLVENVGETHGLEVSLVEAGVPAGLDERVCVLLFRAVRELLHNVAKHARAKRAWVDMECDGQSLFILVKDDGDAFDTAAVGMRGVGLFGIRERLNNLGGRMEIHSECGNGTEVLLVTPLILDGGEGKKGGMA